MATTVITNYQAIAGTIAALGGTSGLQFQATATHLQWKTADTEWTNLVSLAEIGGTDFSLIEWGVSATHLQWRFDGINWVDVIALSALGVTGGITSLTPEAGKIPLASEDGKIASEWVRDVVTATTSPGGVVRLSVGTDHLRPVEKQSRYRAGGQIVESGEIVSRMTPEGAAISFNQDAKYGVLVTPEGRRRPGAVCRPISVGRQGNVDFEQNRVFGPDDVIEVEFWAVDGSSINVYLTATNMTTNLRYNLNQAGARLGEWGYQRGFQTARFRVGEMVPTGAAAPGDLFTKLRVSCWNSSYMRNPEVWVLGVHVNRKERSLFTLSTDDGLLSDLWLADRCQERGIGMTAYLIGSYLNTPPAGYMSVAQAKELRAKGVLIGSHSYSHTYVNGGAVGNVWMSTVDGIATRKTLAGGARALDGVIGASAFDRPRHITFYTSANNFMVYADIVGELDGKTQTERFWFGKSETENPIPSERVYDKVTSITVNANGRTLAGTVQIGTSCSYDEIYGDIRRSFEHLEANGLSDPDERHYCAPRGQWNNTLTEVLLDLGVKTCRLALQSPVSYSGQFDAMRLPAMLLNETQKSRVLWAVNNALVCGLSLNLYTHDIYETGATGGQLLQSSAIEVLDIIAAAQNASGIDMRELCRMTDPAF